MRHTPSHTCCGDSESERILVDPRLRAVIPFGRVMWFNSRPPDPPRASTAVERQFAFVCVAEMFNCSPALHKFAGAGTSSLQ